MQLKRAFGFLVENGTWTLHKATTYRVRFVGIMDVWLASIKVTSPIYYEEIAQARTRVQIERPWKPLQVLFLYAIIESIAIQYCQG